MGAEAYFRTAFSPISPTPPPLAMKASWGVALVLLRAASGDSARAWDAWLAAVPLSRDPLVVEVGANDHGDENRDPGKDAVRAGWRALLYEPLPPTFARLAARYADNQRVRVVNGLVCDDRRIQPGSLCPVGEQEFYSIDINNTRGTHGSATADTRCAQGLFGQWDSKWLSHLASLDRAHLLRHAGIFVGKRKLCAACARRLGKPGALRSGCMRDVIARNMVATRVACVCLAEALAAEQHVDLLTVDAEGHDEMVLNQFPFERIVPAGIVYSAHMSKPAIARTAKMLSALGYKCRSPHNRRQGAEHVFWTAGRNASEQAAGTAAARVITS